MNKDIIDRLEKSLFTTSTPDGPAHRCVVAIDKKHAVTYRHGSTHGKFIVGQTLVLYSVIGATKIEVRVLDVLERIDLIIFKTVDVEFEFYPSLPAAIHCGQDYKQMGVDNNRRPFWRSGDVYRRMTGYYLGHSHAADGDSGAGIYTHDGGFLGISVAKTRFEFNTTHSATIQEIADHFYVKIIGTDFIDIFIYGLVDESDSEPVVKKPRDE